MNMTIGRKLGIGLGAMLFLVLIMGTIFLWASRQAENALARNQEIRELNGLMTARIMDHYVWMDGISSGLFIQEKPFTGRLDHSQCNLGKWMETFKPYSAEITVPFKALFDPHKRLHQTAEKIISEHQAGRRENAQSMFAKETVPAVKAVQESLNRIKEILRKGRGSRPERTDRFATQRCGPDVHIHSDHPGIRGCRGRNLCQGHRQIASKSRRYHQ